LAIPRPRDNKDRLPNIPDTVFEERVKKSSNEEIIKEEIQEEEQPFWLRGFNSIEWKKKYLLKDPEWRFDIIPEVINGINISDYIDPDIMKRLEELEKEEEERLASQEMEEDDPDLVPLTEEQMKMVEQIQEKKKQIRVRKERLVPVKLPMGKSQNPENNIEHFEKHLTQLGIDPTKAVERLRSRSRSKSESRMARKRTRSEDAPMDISDSEEERSSKLQRKIRTSRSRSRSKTPAQEGLKDFKQKLKAVKLARNAQRDMQKGARKGEGDRHIYDLKPKHLLTGKRTTGKTDRR